MEDSTAMTIEFLRARLLSERSVSRAAKERVDELSKRVAELEEQLKIVSLQRKKAEKAASDVLAILERQDVSGLSEDYDSSSDQETPRESTEGTNSVKEGESSVDSKAKRNESDDFSGSEHDFSTVTGGSLSWKGCNSPSRSLDRSRHPSMRRLNSLMSTGSSAKRNTGKSCRQIKLKDTRSVAKESKTESTNVVSQENGIATLSTGLLSLSARGPDILRGGPEIQEERTSAGSENQRNVMDAGSDLDKYGRDEDMERALEHQVQLIDQYEEMEKAQREWEEKFRENNNGTPDSCDPGNHSDITEETDEIKAQAQSRVEIVTAQTSQPQEVKSEVENARFSEELSKTQSNGFQGPSDTNSSLHSYNSPSREFEFPKANGRHSQESPQSSHGYNHYARSPGSQSAQGSNSSHGAEASGSRNNLYTLVPHEQNEELGGVLEALKHAKLSLQHKINVNKLPLAEANPPVPPATRTMDRLVIPVECGKLFRLPTDYPVEAHDQAKTVLSSGPQLSLLNYYPETDRERYLARPYMDPRPSFSTDDRFLTSQYMEVGSRVPAQTQKPYYDPQLDTGLPASSRFTYPAYSSYPNPLLQMSSNGGSSRPSPSSRTYGVLPEDHFSSYDDQIRPNLYR